MAEFSKIIIIKNEVTKEEFLRHALIGIGTDKDAPSNIMDAQFEKVVEYNEEFIVCTCDVLISYSASIGYDRQETYLAPKKKTNSNGRTYEDYFDQEERTRIVTDWAPFSGTVNATETKCVLNSSSDGEEICKLLLKELENSNEENHTEENDTLTIVNNNGLNRAIKMCEDDAYWKEVHWPGDHHKNERHTAKSTIVELKCIKAHVYYLEYTYEGIKYCVYGVAIGNPNEAHNIPTESNTAESPKSINSQRGKEINAAYKKYRPRSIACIVMAVICGLSALLFSEVVSALMLLLLIPMSVCIGMCIYFNKKLNGELHVIKDKAEARIKNLDKLKESNLNKMLIKNGFEPFSNVIVDDVNQQNQNNKFQPNNNKEVINSGITQTNDAKYYEQNNETIRNTPNNGFATNNSNREVVNSNVAQTNDVNNYAQIKSEIYKDMRNKIISMVPKVIIAGLMITAIVIMALFIAFNDYFNSSKGTTIMAIVSLGLFVFNIILSIVLIIFKNKPNSKLLTLIFDICILINLESIIATGISSLFTIDIGVKNICFIFTLLAVIALIIKIFDIVYFIKKNNNLKKTMLITTPLIVLVGITGILVSSYVIPKKYYDEAMLQLKQNDEDINANYESSSYFRNLGWWGDSKNQYNFTSARSNFIYAMQYEPNEDRYDNEYVVQDIIEQGIGDMCSGNGMVYVYYDTNGGTNVNDTNSDTFSSDNWNNNLNSNTTKESCSFVGWELTKFNFYDKNYKVDIYLKAKWEEVSNDFEFTLNSDDTYTLSKVKNKNIKEAIIPKCFNGKEVVTIDDSVFSDCASLTSVIIPNSVTTIGESAFDYCISLRSITIPNSVITIEANAFGDCFSLEIYCEAESKPDGWNSTWNPDNRTVIWNYKNK